MERQQLIRQVSHAAVGLLAAWIVKELGLKRGALAAAVIAVFAHAYLDALVARILDETI